MELEAGGAGAFTTATNPRMKHVCTRAQCPARGGPGEMAAISKARCPRDPKRPWGSLGKARLGGDECEDRMELGGDGDPQV